MKILYTQVLIVTLFITEKNESIGLTIEKMLSCDKSTYGTLFSHQN